MHIRRIPGLEGSKDFILFGFPSLRRRRPDFRPDDSFQLRDGYLVIREMIECRSLGVPEQALRTDPVRKFPLPGLVGRPADCDGLFGVREQLFFEELCMVMRRLDLLQLIAEQSEDSF